MVTMTGAIVRAYRWWLVPAAKDAQRLSKGVTLPLEGSSGGVAKAQLGRQELGRWRYREMPTQRWRKEGEKPQYEGEKNSLI